MSVELTWDQEIRANALVSHIELMVEALVRADELWDDIIAHLTREAGKNRRFCHFEVQPQETAHAYIVNQMALIGVMARLRLAGFRVRSHDPAPTMMGTPIPTELLPPKKREHLPSCWRVYFDHL